jgi:hypothetical protein
VATRSNMLRVYVDTSVLGGCFDKEFELWSNALVRDFRRGRLLPVLSDVTAAEVADAPAQVRELHRELLTIADDILAVTKESMDLAADYEAEGVLSRRFRNDMLHIAVATVAAVDVLVSWNFKHIVRLDKIRLFNRINLELGYGSLTIYSPREVASHE